MDVERRFGVLRSYFAIVRYSPLGWSQDQSSKVINGCVTMHNIIRMIWSTISG
jgi:hypothetical protein